MYELKRNQRFKKLVRMKMVEKDMSVSDLAELTHYSRQSVYNFLSKDNWNRFLAAEIAEKLEIGGFDDD